MHNLRREFIRKDICALFVSQPENIYYLSGFDGSDTFLLITPQDAILATDFRYIEQAERQAPDYEIFQISGRIKDWFPRLMSGISWDKLGFEAGHITFALHQQLVDALGESKPSLKFTPVVGLVESLRIIKEPEEIELIMQASAITDNAIEYVKDIVYAGMSEKELAWEIEKFMREHGSQTLPFEVIAASGPNSALPHAQPSEHIINEGEPIVIDIGARIGGYGSDLSRTLCVGSGDGTYNKVYDIVLEAQLTAIAAMKEGMTGEEADRLARKIIIEAGYGETFGHSLGHGVGLAAHEQPRLGPSSVERLVNGMVFSIEPGIYITGWGGVRIEDTVVMENGKIRVISSAPKNR
ncbi:MAG: aminopeptidase P family protein [Dehalococcoidales bacterium]|nr:aminopeptidase P family protein [Dehalococcoidales bacterium]